MLYEAIHTYYRCWVRMDDNVPMNVIAGLLLQRVARLNSSSALLRVQHWYNDV